MKKKIYQNTIPVEGIRLLLCRLERFVQIRMHIFLSIWRTVKMVVDCRVGIYYSKTTEKIRRESYVLYKVWSKK